MTLTNTRAAGLRQAADWCHDHAKHWEREALKKENHQHSVQYAAHSAALHVAEIMLHRLAQGAESDE